MSRVERIFWGAAILLLPFIFSSGPGEQMREPKARFLVMLMGLFLCSKLWERVSWVLGGAASIVYLWAYFFSVEFPYAELLTFSAALGSSLLIVKAKEHDVKVGLELLEVAGILCAAYAMVLQLAHRDPIMTLIPGADFHRVQVFFGQHTLYGPFAVAVAAIPLFRERYLRALFLFSPIIPIDASFTYLSAAVVISLFLLYRFGGRAVLGLSVAGILVAGVVGYGYLFRKDLLQQEALNDNGRFALWHVTTRVSMARPWLGHGGLGAFAGQFPAFQSAEIRKKLGIDDSTYSPEAKKILAEADYLRRQSGWFLAAHNEFLQAFYEFGAVGLAFAVLLVLNFAWWWFNADDTPESWILGAIFFSFIANSLGNFPLHLIPQALLPLWAYVLVTTQRDRHILEA